MVWLKALYAKGMGMRHFIGLALVLAACFSAGAAVAGTAALGSGQTLTNSSSQCSLPEGTQCGRATYVAATGAVNNPNAYKRIFKCMGHNPAESCPKGFTQIYDVSHSDSIAMVGSTATYEFYCLKATEVTVGVSSKPWRNYDAYKSFGKGYGLTDREVALGSAIVTAHEVDKQLPAPGFGSRPSVDLVKYLNQLLSGSDIHVTTQPLMDGDLAPPMRGSIEPPSTR